MAYFPVGLVLLGMIAFFFVAIIAACLWEKRPVQPYYVPNESDEYDASDDAEQANTEAEAVGYQYGGLCHDGKGRLYRVRYDFWIAPDQCTLAIVGSGTVAGIPVNGVSLYSHKDDDRILWTTNNNGEQDLSGVTDHDTWPHLTFANLLKKHERRLVGSDPRPFPDDDPMAGYFEIRRRQADALVKDGLAYYLDEKPRGLAIHPQRGTQILFRRHLDPTAQSRPAINRLEAGLTTDKRCFGESGEGAPLTRFGSILG